MRKLIAALMLCLPVAGSADGYPYDGSSLRYPKTDKVPLPSGADPTKNVAAVDWNNYGQAIDGLRSAIEGATRPSAASSTPGLAQAALGFLYAKDKGVKCDGSTDDTTQINATIAAAPNGTIVQLPPGRCVITGSLLPTAYSGNSGAIKTVHIRGAGWAGMDDLTGAHTFATEIYIGNVAADVPVFSFQSTRGVTIEDLSIVGTASGTSGSVGIWIKESNSNIRINRVTIDGFDEAVRVGTLAGPSANDDQNFLHGVTIRNVNYAIRNISTESYLIDVELSSIVAGVVYRTEAAAGNVMGSLKLHHNLIAPTVGLIQHVTGGTSANTRDQIVVDSNIIEPTAGTYLFTMDSTAPNNGLGLIITNNTYSGGDYAGLYDPTFRWIKYYGRGPFVFDHNHVRGLPRTPVFLGTVSSGGNVKSVALSVSQNFFEYKPVFLRPAGEELPELLLQGNWWGSAPRLAYGDSDQPEAEASAAEPVVGGRRIWRTAPTYAQTWRIGDIYATQTDGDLTGVIKQSRQTGTVGTLTGVQATATNGSATITITAGTALMKSRLSAGRYIQIGNDCCYREILDHIGSTVYLGSSYGGTTGTGKSVDFGAPVFDGTAEQMGVGVSVIDNGADPTGVADSTAAFHAAFATAKGTRHRRVLVPSGTYLVNSTLNLQDVHGLTIVGAGSGNMQGSRINASFAASRAVFDLVGADHIVFQDFSIVGDSTNKPAAAFLLSRTAGDAGAGTHRFTRIRTNGRFTKAAIVSISSEGNTYDSCDIENSEPGGHGYWTSADNDSGISSSFQSVPATQSGGNTFHTFTGTAIIVDGGSTSSAIRIGPGVTNFTFTGSYTNSNGDAALDLYGGLASGAFTGWRDESSSTYAVKLAANKSLVDSVFIGGHLGNSFYGASGSDFTRVTILGGGQHYGVPDPPGSFGVNVAKLYYSVIQVGDQNIQVRTQSRGNFITGVQVGATVDMSGDAAGNLVMANSGITATNFSGTSSGTNTGDVTVASPGSATAEGLSVSGQAISSTPADATHPGHVSTGTQTFAGAKTLSGQVTLSTSSNGPALAITAVPSGQSGIEIPSGVRFWLDGAGHSTGLTTNSGRVYAIGGLTSSADVVVSTSIQLGSTCTLQAGSGSPEGVVTAAACSIYLNTAGGASTTLYVKQSGSGNTGWVGK